MKELEQVAALVEKTGSIKILESFFKEGNINPLTLQMLNEENLCETFGWTPKDLEEQDTFVIDAFTAILRGKNKGRESKK